MQGGEWGVLQPTHAHAHAHTFQCAATHLSRSNWITPVGLFCVAWPVSEGGRCGGWAHASTHRLGLPKKMDAMIQPNTEMYSNTNVMPSDSMIANSAGTV